MELDNYVVACKNFRLELQNLLTPEDKSALIYDIRTLGNSGWCHWQAQNEELIFEFVSATPSARRARKSWKDPVLRRRLILGSLYHVIQARILLGTICEMHLEAGSSYRDMAARAGEAYNRIVLDEAVPLWPLEGENPFVT